MREELDRAPLAPLILGHRGAPAEAPENTLVSFRRALDLGADGVELDVQPSLDRMAVVIHDPTLERTTSERGAVAERPASTLSTVDAGYRFSRDGGVTFPYRGGKALLPALEEVARWAGESGAWLNVEIKAPGAEEATLELLERHELLGRTLLSSFVPEVLSELRRLAPGASRWLLVEAWGPGEEEVARRVGAVGVCLADAAATGPALDRLRAAALPVVVWTVDDGARIEALLRARVRGVITNLPEAGVAARRRFLESRRG